MALESHHEKRLHVRRSGPSLSNPSQQQQGLHNDELQIPSPQLSFNDVKISPSTLHELSQEQPSPRTMRDLIRIAYRDENLSPGFIEDIILNLAQDQKPNEALGPFEPTGTSSLIASGSGLLTSPGTSLTNDLSGIPLPIEATLTSASLEDSGPLAPEHMYGVNDSMSGGLAPGEQAPCLPLNDHLDCTGDIHDEMRYMKWRILDAQDLAEIPGLFNYPDECFHMLGPGFLTTNEGLRRAIEECTGTGYESNEMDTLVLGALARRGGKCDEKGHRGHYWREPLYPEDMEPIIDQDLDLHDKAYWDDLRSQSIFDY